MDRDEASEFHGFEWDADKSALNLWTRGYGFEFASRVFDGPCLRRSSSTTSGETRFAVFGRVEGLVILVVWTTQQGRRRIISSRVANIYEQRKYWAYRASFPGGSES